MLWQKPLSPFSRARLAKRLESQGRNNLHLSGKYTRAVLEQVDCATRQMFTTIWHVCMRGSEKTRNQNACSPISGDSTKRSKDDSVVVDEDAKSESD